MRKFMLITCGSVKVLNMSWYKSGHGTGQPLSGQLIYFLQSHNILIILDLRTTPKIMKDNF